MIAPSDPPRRPNAYWLPPDKGRNFLLCAEYLNKPAETAQ